MSKLFLPIAGALVGLSMTIGGFVAAIPFASAAVPCSCSVSNVAGADDAAKAAACDAACPAGLTGNHNAGGSCLCNGTADAALACEQKAADNRNLRCGSTEAPATPGGQRLLEGCALNPLEPNPEGCTGAGSATDLRVIIGKVIKFALGIVGSLALLMFMYGGGIWLTSGGSTEKIKKGQETITWAVIGLVVIFFSYALVNLVIGALTR